MILILIIEKKINVPANVITLLNIPELSPTILLVAAAINVKLDAIKNVVPPLDVNISWIHMSRPSSIGDVSGIIAPPCNAKFTELNNPPITKKKRNVLIIFRFNALLVSDGCIAFSVIFNPYRNPITKAGTYNIVMMIGFSKNKSAKNVLRITAIINAAPAPAPKTKKFEYLKNFESPTSE